MKLTRLSFLCALGLGACDSCGPGSPALSTAPSVGDPPPSATAEAVGPATGVLRGKVRLAEGVELPGYSPEQMEKRVLDHAKRGPWPDSCTPPKQQDRQPVRAGDGGGLSGIVIAASEFSHQPRRPQRVHELVIRDCRLEPTTVSAMVGDVLRVRNEVDYPFMPSYGNEPQLRTLSPGQNYDVKLEKPGVTPVLCGFTAPCGRSEVVVMMHPLSVVTDAEGAFRIEDFPADEKVKLSAWHPLFQEASLEVELTRGEEKEVELVIRPLPGAVPAAQEPGEGGAVEAAETERKGEPSEPAKSGKSATSAKSAESAKSAN